MDADAPPQAHENEVDMMDAESTDTTQSPTHTNGVNGHTTEQPEKSDQTAQAESEKQTQKPKEPVIDKEAAEAFKEAGNKAFKSREWQDAIEEYTKAITADPTTASYLSNRAAAYMSAGRYEAALGDCRAADRIDPNNEKTLNRMARILTSIGDAEAALEVYDRLKSPASSKDRIAATTMHQHVERAKADVAAGKAGSMTLFALDQAAQGLAPSVTKSRKWRLLQAEAQLIIGTENALGEAQNITMSLLRNNSQDPDAMVLRGRALYAQGENAKALSHFRSALACDPDMKQAVKYLRMVQKLDRMKEDGNALFKSGSWQNAVDKYTEALDVDPTNKGTNAKLLQNRAMCYSKLKDYTKAMADCDEALKRDPTYTKARRTKAKAMGESGNWEEAVRELKTIQEENPSDPGIAKEIKSAELELKKSKRKDHYKILGVDKDADDGQLKKAYRKLAIIHHPDKNPNDDAAAERFKDVQEAYETLSDPEKRAAFDSGEDLMDPADMFGGGGGHFHGGMGGMGGMGGIDPEMLFNMMGGGGGGRGGGSPFGGGGFQFR